MKNLIVKLKNNKIYLGFIAISLILIFFSLVSFIKINILQKIPFFIFGIWTIYFMFLCIYCTIKKAGLKISKFFWVTAIISMMICFCMYLIIIINTKQIYAWDQKCYYSNQIDLKERFDESFLAGIKRIVGTTYKNDYGYFLLSFTTIPFSFSNMSEYAFIVTYAFWLILPVILAFLLNIENIIQKLKLKNGKLILIISAIMLISLPLLHKAAIIGQPDIFGLFWVGLILLLTFNYDFSKKDYIRWGMIILFSFLLAITRRWYLFFMIGYYLVYGIVTVIDTILKKDKTLIKNVIKNAFIFIVIAAILLGILLFPIIEKTIIANYSVSYADWKLGGITYELMQQTGFIGYIAIALMICGIIYGLINKDIRKYTIIWTISYFVIMFLFNMVQSMSYHQSLILVPEYILLLSLGIIGICQIKNKIALYSLSSIILLYFISSMYGTLSENTYFFKNKYYSNISLKPVYRKDYEAIGEVVTFIKENCNSKGDKVYPNFASGTYCGDTFRYYLMPDKSLMDIVYYESSIDNVHGFPIGILDSKYVLIANKVLDSTGATKSTIIPTINDSFKNDEMIRNKFEMVKEFKITNDITFYCYERKSDFDQVEAEYWKEKFKEQTSKNPKLFNERIDNYLKKMVVNNK